MPHARVELRGAEVVLVRDALVVEGEDVGQVGPPVQHLQAEIAAGRGAPDVEFGLVRQVLQQRAPEARKILYAVVNLAQPAGVADREAGGQLAASAAAAAGTAAHFPPSTTIRLEPWSGWLGSLSTRMISSLPTVTRSEE